MSWVIKMTNFKRTVQTVSPWSSAEREPPFFHLLAAMLSEILLPLALLSKCLYPPQPSGQLFFPIILSSTQVYYILGPWQFLRTQYFQPATDHFFFHFSELFPTVISFWNCMSSPSKGAPQFKRSQESPAISPQVLLLPSIHREGVI